MSTGATPTADEVKMHSLDTRWCLTIPAGASDHRDTIQTCCSQSILLMGPYSRPANEVLSMNHIYFPILQHSSNWPEAQIWRYLVDIAIGSKLEGPPVTLIVLSHNVGMLDTTLNFSRLNRSW